MSLPGQCNQKRGNPTISAIGTKIEVGPAERTQDPMMRTLLNKIDSAHTGPLIKGLAAFGAAELAVRSVRLIAVIIIARQLAPEIVGVAALTLTAFELTRVLANIGVGQQIIAADADRLDALCNSAHRIFWIWCGVVAMIQLLVATILAFGFGQMLAGQMLAVLSLVYMFMPGGLVQCFLLMREGRASTTAATAAFQTIADHVLTAALLIVWPNPWSIVLPKLLTAPIWLILTRRARAWSVDLSAGFVPARDMLRFGTSVLLTEMMVAMRSQVDKLIIAATLGVSSLGTYFFAFNAGIGVSSSLISAFGTVALPWLCATPAGRARSRKLHSVILLGSCLFLPIILLQALFAPYYVPIIFGDNWAHAVPLISILCLAGIPMLFTAIATAWLRASGKPDLDAKAGLASCSAALGGLYIGTQFGSVEAAAVAWLLGLTIVSLPFSWLVLSQAKRENHQKIIKETFA
jgi:O-antigen/teichoic acid export membrane protein